MREGRREEREKKREKGRKEKKEKGKRSVVWSGEMNGGGGWCA